MTVNPTKPDHSTESRDLTFTLLESKTGAGVVAGLLFAVFVLNVLVGTPVMNRLFAIANLTIGVWLIGFRPMFRTGPRFHPLEFVVGLLLLLGAWERLGYPPR